MRTVATKLGAALVGIAVVVVVCAATPAALATLAVFVWPHSWSWEAIGPARLGVLVADGVAWVAWAVYLAGLVTDVAAQVRRRDQPAPVTSGVRAELAGWVAGLVLMVVPVAILTGTAAGAAPLVPRVSISVPAPTHAAVAVSTVMTSSPSESPPAADTAPTAPAPVTTTTYTVVAGDCLSTIAERFYGDEGAWNEIWAANADRLMADGERFSDPNLIMPGWTLTLPGASVTAPAGTTATAPVTTPSGGPTTGPASTPTDPTPTAPEPVAGTATPRQTTPTQPAASHAAPAPTMSPTTDGPALPKGGTSTPARGVPDHAVSAPRAGQEADSDHRRDAPAPDPLVRWVPEAAALGVSAVVAAALLRRMRRGRAKARAARGDDEVVVEASAAAIAIESRAAPLADVPALDWLELANRHLSEAFRAEGLPADVPRVELVRVGPGGVELLLDTPVDWSPGAFTVTDDGHTWRLGPDVDRQALSVTASGYLAYLPLLVPVGDDSSGTYLLHLVPGQTVSVEGPEAEGMVRAWAAAAKAWPWAEQVGVACDPERAEELAPLFEGQVALEDRGTVLFVGDRDALSPRARETVAAVATDAVEAELRVVVVADRAVIEPFGIAVRPCILGAETDQALDATLDWESLIPASDAIAGPPGNVPGGEGGAHSGSELVEPGPIEARLLTFTPELVGLDQPLPTEKRVRITELVAWLALHGDRGSTAASMVDHGICGAATEKTIYNMVSAARGALGTDASGIDRLLLDRATGLYRLTGEVTVDVLRFEEMATAGVTAAEPEDAVRLCEAALALIEDAPVGNGHGRFGWWSGTWGARVGRLAIKAARRLAVLAQGGAVDFETARWGIERARLAADGEEELHRVAMELEAFVGDHDRVEAEWETVCRQAEELDPGSAPSEGTEALYGAIRRRWQREGQASGG